jgi:hypothetical protein
VGRTVLSWDTLSKNLAMTSLKWYADSHIVGCFGSLLQELVLQKRSKKSLVSVRPSPVSFSVIKILNIINRFSWRSSWRVCSNFIIHNHHEYQHGSHNITSLVLQLHILYPASNGMMTCKGRGRKLWRNWGKPITVVGLEAVIRTLDLQNSN